jgi:serine/threonine protein kinase
MTVPSGSGALSSASDMMPLGAPFNDASISDTSRQHQSSAPAPHPPRTRTNWSLWPLKMPSSSRVTHSTSHDQVGAVYAASSSSSPPSPFGPDYLSDPSPPSTPPDYASTSYGSNSTKYVSPQSTKVIHQHLSPQTPSITASSPSSRNNIFSSPAVSPVPAPRLQTAHLEGFASGRIGRNISKNVGSFESPTSGSTLSPPSSISTSTRAISDYVIDSPDAGRPSYGRANTEERAIEMDRVRRNNAEVDFRLCPVRDYLLGEGRHCTVYLGSFRTKRTRNDSGNRQWTLCAIKRLHADRQSQLLGLEEAFALRRLGPHPNIVGLISIRDEVELAVTSPIERPGERSWSGVAIPLSPLSKEHQEDVQYGHSSSSNSNRGPPSSPGMGMISHWRSSSDSQADPIIASEKVATRRIQTHRRQVSTPTNAPIVMIASPEGDEVYHSPFIPESISWDDNLKEASPDSNGSSTVDPPRLLMLLELLPYSLSSFAKKNSDRVDLAQWKRWAIELTGVVEWLHAKGCVHADLKPENVLLTSDLTVKLCDFNSALFPTPNTPLTDGLGLGTPAYGAPELASRSSKGFSYPVDIWSLGAILYTLAVGAEPFRKARSMIDILHRKGRFFESEENDRIASLSVAEGRAASINGGSTTASRNGSIRGRRRGESDVGSASTTRPGPPPMLQRELSTESISSIASSVMLSGSSGRNPSVRAVSMLLEPSPPFGVVVPQHNPSLKHFQFGRSNSNTLSPSSAISPNQGPHRATSLGKGESNSLLSPTAGASRRINPVSRPTTFRRTTSFGDVEALETLEQDKNGSVQEKETVVDQTSVTDSSSLRLAVTAAFAQSSREESQKIQAMDDEEDLQLQRPYKDGSPALLLPGGGRLPDVARDLLEKMLSTDANRRPTATQVKQMLLAL